MWQQVKRDRVRKNCSRVGICAKALTPVDPEPFVSRRPQGDGYTLLSSAQVFVCRVNSSTPLVPLPETA